MTATAPIPTTTALAPFSYTALHGIAPFDWWQFLRHASAGVTSDRDYAEALERAQSWLTCPAGYQSAMLPRKPDGEPHDRVLSRLAWIFLDDLQERDFDGAFRTLDRACARAAKLLGAGYESQIDHDFIAPEFGDSDEQHLRPGRDLVFFREGHAWHGEEVTILSSADGADNPCLIMPTALVLQIVIAWLHNHTADGSTEMAFGRELW